MRAYLLGMLDDQDASLVEEQYFLDKDFFRKMQLIERQLITEYVDGRLEGADRERFEGRYLKVPLLRQLVDSVRQHRNAESRRARLVWVFYAVAVLVVAVLGTMVYRSTRAVSTTTEMAKHVNQPPPLGELTLRLSFGVTKGPSSQLPRLSLPSSDTVVRLIAELPGRHSVERYATQLFLITADGQRQQVWSSPGIVSVPVQGGAELYVKVHSSLLVIGDYLLVVSPLDNNAVQNTFLFRIIPNKS